MIRHGFCIDIVKLGLKVEKVQWTLGKGNYEIKEKFKLLNLSVTTSAIAGQCSVPCSTAWLA